MASNAAKNKIDFNEMKRIVTVHLDEHETVVTTDVIAFLEHLFPDGTIEGDPGVWGVILADVVRHVAAAHHEMFTAVAEAKGAPPPEALELFVKRVREVMNADLDRPSTETSDFIYHALERGLN